MPRIARTLRSRLAGPADKAAGTLAAGLLRMMRLFDRNSMAALCAATARTIGPFLPEHKTGRAQLKAAFPEKSDFEVEAILRGVWDNLGRVAAEFAHLDRIRTFDPAVGTPSDIEYSDAAMERFHALRTDGKPALIFTAHLANWELPAQVAHSHGLDTVVLYRRPNLGAVADAVVRIRSGSMGELVATSLDAPVRLARELLAGRHVGMLVDQYYTRGTDVTFFGRRTRANPLIARLARQVEAPIHGVRMIRLPGGRFRADVTPEIKPTRDSEGKVDIAETMQAIMGVIEGWVREHPEQWLWLHRRWRDDPPR